MRAWCVARADPHELQQRHAAVDRVALLRAVALRAEQGARDGRLVPRVCADGDVLERRHVGEQADVLERPRDAASGDLVALRPDDGTPVEDDVARRRPVDARHRVEGGRLAGAVRADEPEDLAALDVERDVVERSEAAELHGDVAQREQRLADMGADGALGRDHLGDYVRVRERGDDLLDVDLDALGDLAVGQVLLADVGLALVVAGDPADLLELGLARLDAGAGAELRAGDEPAATGGEVAQPAWQPHRVLPPSVRASVS